MRRIQRHATAHRRHVCEQGRLIAMKDVMSRRTFVQQTCAIATGAMFAGPLVASAVAEEHGAALGRGGTDGYVMDSTVTQRCATCEFWGGARRLSLDRKSITVTGLGWCNNSASANYQKLTSPEHGPMEVWKKWQLLG
jgi:hypothetical protein